MFLVKGEQGGKGGGGWGGSKTSDPARPEGRDVHVAGDGLAVSWALAGAVEGPVRGAQPSKPRI